MSAGERTVGLDALWHQYQLGQVSADHTARQVFCEVLAPLLSERETLLSLAHKFARECSECNGTGKSMEFVETLGADGEADAERVQLDCYSCRDIRAVICGDPDHPMASQADAQIAALTAEREALREALELCATLAYCGGTSYEELEPVRSALALAQPVKP